MQFLCISEIVLCANLRTILSVDKNNSLISNVQSCDCTTNEVIRTRAVNNIKLFVVPLNMEYCRENRITIFMLNWEVVTYRVLCLHCTTAFDDTTTENHRLGKSGLAATRTA